MENILNITTAKGFEIGKAYIESNYYLNECVGKGIVFTTDYGTIYQEVVFNVTTLTGRVLGKETRKFIIN